MTRGGHCLHFVYAQAGMVCKRVELEVRWQVKCMSIATDGNGLEKERRA